MYLNTHIYVFQFFFFYQYMCQFFILIFITISMWGVFFFLNNSNKVFKKNNKSGLVDIYMCQFFLFISTCLSFFFFLYFKYQFVGVFFFLLNNNKVLKNKNKSRLLGEYSYFVGTILVQLKHVFYQIIFQFYLYLNIEKYEYFGKNKIRSKFAGPKSNISVRFKFEPITTNHL